MNCATQSATILEALESGRRLTPLEALDDYGIFRLAARVWDLRQAGHLINRELVSLDSGKRVARYSLIRRNAN